MYSNLEAIVYSMLSAMSYPVDLEISTDSKTTLPCITYLSLNESELAQGDTINYETVAYQVKAWGRTMSELATIKYDLKKIFKENGWHLLSTQTTSHEGVICVTMTIEAVTYNKED